MPLPNYQYGTIPTPDEFNAFIRPRFDRDPDEDEYPGHLQRLLDSSLSNESGNVKPDFRNFENGLRVTAGVGLNILFNGGTVELITNTKIVVLSGSLVVPNNTTVWIYVGDNGVVSYSVGYPNNVIVMAKVTTFANAVTTIDDYRDRKTFKISRHIFSGDESTEGLLKIATQENVFAGEDDTKAISSLKLDLWKKYNNLVSSKPGGNIFYVDEKSGKADDSLLNPGTDQYSPFRTIERAVLEVARRSYRPNINNQTDAYDEATIYLAPGNYIVDNRPGVSDFVQIQPLSLETEIVQPLQVGNIQSYNTETKILTLANTSEATYEELKPGQQIFGGNGSRAIIDISINDTGSYKIKNIVGSWNGIGDIVVVTKYSYFNPPTGGVVVPRGCSIVASDLRKTKIIPRYVGDVPTWELNNPYDPNLQCECSPDNSSIGRTAIFKGTGGSLITGLTFFDNKSIKTTHHLCSTVEPASTLELSDESYGYYPKIERAFSNTLNPSMNAGELDVVSEETIITAPAIDNTSVDDDGFLDINSINGSSVYIFNCSLRSRFGMCGISCDGSKLQGLKSIVASQFTNVSLQSDPRAFVVNLNSPGGKSYKDTWRHFSFSATNDGYMQIVSCFVICAGTHFKTLSGGELSVTNSCSNFGDISLFADGYSNHALPQDSGGTITKIVPPKPIVSNVLNYAISGFVASLSTPTKIYIDGPFDPQRISPFSLLQNELIYVVGVDNVEYSARLISSSNLVSTDSNGHYFNVLDTNNGIYTNRSLIDTLPVVIKRNPDERQPDDRIFWFRVDGVPLLNRSPQENYVLKFNADEMPNLQINKNLFISSVKSVDSAGNVLPDGSYYISLLNADGINDKNDDLYPELNVDIPDANSVLSKSYIAAKAVILALTIPEEQAIQLLETSNSERLIRKDNQQVTIYPEFIKPSLIRASGHTWEWVGYGNYSSALPKFQTKGLTLAESVTKMKRETNGGRVYSCGMDQDGNYFIGDKVIDIKTGNETNLNSGESDSKVFKRLTITERLFLYPNSTLDLRSALLNFDIRSRFSVPIPTDSGIYATTESPGFVELTTNQEAIDGLDDKRAVTPASLAAALAGIIASIGEVEGQIPATPNYSDILDAVTPVGTIKSVFRTTLPSSRWEFARGQEVLRSAINSTLASELAALGAPYNGNGTTTVRLPNGDNRTLVGAGGDYLLGATGGAKEVSLTINQTPNHTHTADHAHSINDPGHNHTFGDRLSMNRNTGSGANGGEVSTVGYDVVYTGTNATGITINSTSVTTSSQGSNEAHNNMQPYLAVNFIIKVR